MSRASDEALQVHGLAYFENIFTKNSKLISENLHLRCHELELWSLFSQTPPEGKKVNLSKKSPVKRKFIEPRIHKGLSTLATSSTAAAAA